MDIKNPFPMAKSTFKGISFLGVLNFVAVHSQTKKYLEIISTPRVGKVKHARVFQIALGEKSPLPEGGGGMGSFGESRNFFIG